MSFSKDFKWCVATSAYQIEGAADIDGKGESVWDVMCRKEGAVFEGNTGDVACDHYHRYKEDVKIMKEIGVDAFRLSFSWPRIMPEGIGKINSKGIDFYNRLIDELLDNGIEPNVTLFHWDYPQALFLKGGWLNPESSDWFAEYTKVVMEHFSDKIKNWITINEPQCFITAGYNQDNKNPGDSLTFKEVLISSGNVLLSHGKSVQAIREYSKRPANIGYAPVGHLYVPYDENSQADIDAAREATFNIKPKECFNSTFWMDPVLLGEFSENTREVYGADMPVLSGDDMKIIAEPIDFIGVNIYFADQVKADEDGKPVVVKREPGYAHTAMGWVIEPRSLYWGPKFFCERYQIPVMITENGYANLDVISLDGKVHDPQRIDYLARYMRQLKRACADRVDVRGYFLWSFLDNFEWAFGYSKRFGLVHVDLETQKRTIKDSAYWYKDVIKTNGYALGDQ
jgi:beta-glucosidase